MPQDGSTRSKGYKRLAGATEGRGHMDKPVSGAEGARYKEKEKVMSEQESEEFAEKRGAARIRQERFTRMEREREEEQERRHGADEQRLQAVAEKWGKNCPLCTAKEVGEKDGTDHSLGQCPGADESYLAELLAEAEEMQSSMKRARFSGCWNCGMPRGICNGWLEVEQHDGKTKWMANGLFGTGRCEFDAGGWIEAIVVLRRYAGEDFLRWVRRRSKIDREPLAKIQDAEEFKEEFVYLDGEEGDDWDVWDV